MGSTLGTKDQNDKVIARWSVPATIKDSYIRLCRCSAGVQTVWLIFTECHLTRDLAQIKYNSLDEVFGDENVHNVFLAITKKLKIQIW